MSEERWLTFDCFGTLVSWQRGFPEILAEVAGDRAPELAAAYHDFERELELEAYRPYREILGTGVERAAQSLGISLAAPGKDVLALRWNRQPVFGDVAGALTEARATGWKLAALTNCDVDLFAATRATLPVDFDLVVTAEDVRSYKPALPHFARFAATTGVSRDRWIHVACSWYHDVVPAKTIGVNRIWVDRDRTGQDPADATCVRPDLTNLAETAAAIVERPAPDSYL